MKRFSILSIIICVALFVAYSCKCTQNVPSIEKNEQTQTPKQAIILDDVTDEYSASLNDELHYTHEVHASVGSSYFAEYDTTAFEVKDYMKFDNPESVRAGMCGGDRGKKTSIFIPQKAGKYDIKIYHNFRGEITDSITFKVNVK